MKNTFRFIETVTCREDDTDCSFSKNYSANYANATSSLASMSKPEHFEVPQRYVERFAPPDGQHGASELDTWNTHMKIAEISDQVAVEATQFRQIPRDEPKDTLLNLAFPEIKANITKPKSSVPLVIDDLTIPWSDLVVKERIGAGKHTIYLISSFNCDVTSI